jgi:hypothetical protein
MYGDPRCPVTGCWFTGPHSHAATTGGLLTWVDNERKSEAQALREQLAEALSEAGFGKDELRRVLLAKSGVGGR